MTDEECMALPEGALLSIVCDCMTGSGERRTAVYRSIKLALWLDGNRELVSHMIQDDLRELFDDPALRVLAISPLRVVDPS